MRRRPITHGDSEGSDVGALEEGRDALPNCSIVRSPQLAHRPKQCKLAQSPTLARLVTHKLQNQWSSEQIAGRLKRSYPNDDSLQVSHDAIYRSLCIQVLEHLGRTGGCAAHVTTHRRPTCAEWSLTRCLSGNVWTTSQIGPHPGALGG